jgi:transposase
VWPLTEAACWAHARRKIHDVYISTRTATAEALKRISELYAIEEKYAAFRHLSGWPPDGPKLPLLISLHDWLVEKSATLSKKSRLGEAFAYALNQWDALCYYCDDGLAEPDNNAAERALRAVCLGKKTTSSSAVIMVVNVVPCCMV